MRPKTPKFEGLYLEDAMLILNDDPRARYPFHLDPGSHWVLWLSASEKKWGLGTNNLRVTTVLMEFAEPPVLDQTLDLASAPLQASYEFGGQSRTYIARQVSGTLTLHDDGSGTWVADIDALFSEPIFGEGEQQVQTRVFLQRQTLDQFSYLKSTRD